MSLPSPPTYDAHYTSTGLKPYLELPHLLSLTWLAYPILSLIFIAFRLQLSLDSSQDAIASAKDNLLASCKAAERAATTAASMPRFMAVATNEQIADAVNGTMNAARATLVLALTIMEAVINFMIDIYRSTLFCFLELVIRGGLAIIIAAVQEFSQVVHDAAQGLQSGIQDSINGANSVISDAINAINKVNPFSDISAPTIPVPDLSSLDNVTLPTTFTDALTKLNDTLPTFNDIKEKIEQVIDTPFELLKKDINDTFIGINFNSSTLPVPQQNNLAFCDDMDLSVVDDLGRDLVKAAKIGIIIIILLILILIGLSCLLEWYKWRCQKAHLEYTRQAWTTDPTMYQQPKVVDHAPQMTLTDHNLLMLQANGSHPLITRIVNQLSARLRLSPSKHTNLSWFLHYILHPPALACFLIGFFGLLSVQVQLLAIGPLVDKYDDRAAATANDFTNTIAASINGSMYNQSSAYANDVNGQILGVQTTINDGMFGWVNTTTTTLNDTLVSFYDEIQGAVSTVFNGTFLEQPAQEFLRCFIGSKVEALENALTFLHDNLHVNMPTVNETALVLSQSQVDEASRPIAAAALGSGDGDDNNGLVAKLVNAYAESLKKERIMFAIFLGLWGLVVLMAIGIILWNSYGKAWVERRNRRKWERDQRAGGEGFVAPFRISEPTPLNSNEKGPTQLRDLTPLPSPTPQTIPRSPSPKPVFKVNNVSRVGSGPLETDVEQGKSWDNFFGGLSGAKKEMSSSFKPIRKSTGRFPTISYPKRLTGFGKTPVEDKFSEQDTRAPPVLPMDQNKRNTAWYTGLFAAMSGKKANDTIPDPYPYPYPASSSASATSSTRRLRPNLRISVERASTLRDGPLNNEHDAQMNSRWSTSPVEEPQEILRVAPWMGMLSPTRRSMTSPTQTQRSAAPNTRSPPRKEVNVPADVNSIYESSQMQIESAVPITSPVSNPFLSPPSNAPTFAPPLHHGFTGEPMNEGNIAGVGAGKSSLAPPPDHHRRSSSVPGLPASFATTGSSSSALFGSGSVPSDSSPMTRYLTANHARRSSSSFTLDLSPNLSGPLNKNRNTNPFATPFDDEHRVTIQQAPARKSMQTNPFEGVAI
ncbi:plasma membrane fusion protein prm1 [Stygiomarasmius scandens]|uniref:Plasma membrane fusion protein PRM1 n=1 Tax=Marasmiellus scandens TaxID=2682957 RepID=A0ABR1KC32_9AGAR